MTYIIPIHVTQAHIDRYRAHPDEPGHPVEFAISDAMGAEWQCGNLNCWPIKPNGDIGPLVGLPPEVSAKLLRMSCQEICEMEPFSFPLDLTRPPRSMHVKPEVTPVKIRIAE